MKIQICILISLLILVFISCKKQDLDEKKEKEPCVFNVSDEALDYLSDKGVISIVIYENNLWIHTSRICDTCYKNPYSSRFPYIEEWTVINDSTFKNHPSDEYPRIPKTDNDGKFYLKEENIIYKLNNSGEYEELFNAGDYYIKDYAFDKDNNIWLYGGINGLAFWNKSQLTIYNTTNSQLPTDMIHGMATDNIGTVWISLGTEGLLKIESGNWTIIPISEIPGLGENSYLIGPLFVTERSIWFEVHNSYTNNGILRLENENWIYEYPEIEDSNLRLNMKLELDYKGVIWLINSYFNYGDFLYSTLKYYNNSSWINVDLSMVKERILTVNSDDIHIFIGTHKGLKVINK